MYKKSKICSGGYIYLIFLFPLLLGLANGQARGQSRVVYWDGNFRTWWADDAVTIAIRDDFENAGYEILDAYQLKTFMVARIADGAKSVVVFCRDNAPDTIVESISVNCTLRRYLDAGGKIVWYSDVPLWDLAHSDGTFTYLGGAGSANILGITGIDWTNNTGSVVTLTDDGIDWGLTETWVSQRWTPADQVDIVLASDRTGNAAAWVKHFVPGDTTGGFVRIWDNDVTPDSRPSFEDLLAVAEYGMGSHPCACNPDPADGAMHLRDWIRMTWNAGDCAVSHDVYFGENFDDVNDGTADAFRGNLKWPFFIAGFSPYPYPEGLVYGKTYYWRIDEVNDADPKSPWKGDVWSFWLPPRKAYGPVPSDGGEFIDAENPVLSWTPGVGSVSHTLYFGDDYNDVSNAAGGTASCLTTCALGPLELAKTYYWRVDGFDNVNTHKGDVWSFTTEGAAAGPKPADGDVDVKPSVVLGWNAGVVAASHDVYFGTDADAVMNATTDSPEYMGSRALGDESYYPGILAWASTYYWRIDEVNNLHPDGRWVGSVWSFTTADFVIVDDFEDYDAGDNRIFYAWLDGLGYGYSIDPPYLGNGTGSTVGDENTSSFTEKTIVHSGGRSMSYWYDNNKQGCACYSEADLTLTDPRDWTDGGVVELSLWFRGISTNDAELLYVVVSNAAGEPAVVVHDDVNAVQIETWTEWVIPLQTFADQGIVLTDVDKIAIGLGTKGNITVPGGSGKMYFDGIRLYRPREAAE
jgi:hypothetical protein